MRQDLIGSLFRTGGFSETNFPDLFNPLWIAALLLLIGTVILYNVQTRRLHRHPPLVALQEWLLWTGITVFGLLLVYATFKFYFVFVVGTVIVGCATFIWIRFVRFPPIIAGYNQQLRRARFQSQQRYRNPESTVRQRKSTTRQRRRRR